MDPRIEKLADLLVSYSCRVQEGEKVLISYEGDCCKPLVKQIIRNVYKKAGCRSLRYATRRSRARS